MDGLDFQRLSKTNRSLIEHLVCLIAYSRIDKDCLSYMGSEDLYDTCQDTYDAIVASSDVEAARLLRKQDWNDPTFCALTIRRALNIPVELSPPSPVLAKKRKVR